MQRIGNRAALILAYLVSLVYVCWPVMEHPRTLFNPIGQILAIAFFSATLVALISDRLRLYTKIVAWLNGLAGLCALVATVWAVLGNSLGRDELFDLPAIVYFAIAVPLVACMTLLADSRTREHRGSLMTPNKSLERTRDR